ncbi:YbaB/EbfC family nucleoid-associated protein [Actinokineospora globicatena]|uniref:YbaB/EbfC family nucleoid-associated protein n=1 Tax=Actinokineospora globicatena TaxID=103729 RepID=UPI0020A288BE|nr:YbaB/EbfC family nucleoid-associated protein [Actinokineospora globicatena]MCP2303944.1 YbaB/EbfC DNA-binding family protein [Actinokineospora globicatena]GLW78894.1 hypothetical protein Aglo01_33760 [Actinokineospora globicatena]GLW86693.1 hypothetical protein Aglo02_43320 [Actinokineospora globicatena]
MDERVTEPDDVGQDSVRQRLAAWQARADQLAADTEAMSSQFEQLRVTKTDPAGMAEVVVDSGGALVGLTLTREIERAAPSVVASTIMSTIQAAKAELAERAQGILAETLGTESPVARAVAAQVSERMGVVRSADEQQDRPRRRTDEDEDNEMRVFGRVDD